MLFHVAIVYKLIFSHIGEDGSINSVLMILDKRRDRRPTIYCSGNWKVVANAIYGS